MKKALLVIDLQYIAFAALTTWVPLISNDEM